MATTEPGQLWVWDRPVERSNVDAAEIRDLLTALARTNFTTDNSYPTTPREGMQRIDASDPTNVKWDIWQGDPGAWRTMLQHIEGGVAAPVKQVVQVTAAATTWTIDHNLGSRVVAQVLDTSFDQLRLAHTLERALIFLAKVDLSAFPGPGVIPIRLGVPTPFDGLIRRSWLFPTYLGVVAPGVSLSFDLDIGGTPVTGGSISVVGTLPPAARVDGAAITANNAIVKGNDDINLTANVTAPGLAGDVVEVHVELEKTLQADEYLLEQPTENRIVVTHPTAKTGWVVLIG